MKSSHLLAGALVALLPVLALSAPGVANATTITLNNPSASFSNPVQVDSSKDANINYKDGGAEIRFGIPTDNTNNEGSQQSGLRFDVFGSSQDVHPGETFELGTLSHFNWEVKTGTSLTSVTLTFTFDIENGVPQQVDFSFDLGIDETANSGQCAYGSPGDTQCPDRISFPQTQGSEQFKLGGDQYTLDLLGFSQTSGGPLSHNFITQEFQNNSINLYGKISEARVSVPEPSSLMMMGFGLLTLLGFLGLRSKLRTDKEQA